MKKFKVNWPGIIAVSIGLTLVSCHHDKVQEKYKAEQTKPVIESINMEDMFQPAEKYKIDEIIYEPFIEEPETPKTK